MTPTPWHGWHTDVTAAINPPFASILRGVTISPHSGGTFWTNLVVAYEQLSPVMRGFVDGLKANHPFKGSGTSVYDEAVSRRRNPVGST
jgi:alpha-ketoglutarate-dependent sulfate ester dioxygenase